MDTEQFPHNLLEPSSSHGTHTGTHTTDILSLIMYFRDCVIIIISFCGLLMKPHLATTLLMRPPSQPFTHAST